LTGRSPLIGTTSALAYFLFVIVRVNPWFDPRYLIPEGGMIINNMMGIGIVFLPGMMTGQILAGVARLDAIKYQIAVMLGIGGSVSITVFLVTELGYRRFFNSHSQIRREVLEMRA
jgi:ABC-type iron transport system FetAB permease component